MVDVVRIEERLRRLNVLVSKLNEYRAAGREKYLNDVDTQLGLDHALQNVIQICIDIGSHIIAERGYETPGDYSEVFDILASNGVIERNLAERLSKATGTRNALVYAYLNIDREQIWSDLEGMDDFSHFAKSIEEAIQ